MTRLIAALALVALACGATLPVAVNTDVHINTPTDIPDPVQSNGGLTYISRSVHGCWNLRQSPGLDGVIAAVVCDKTVIVKPFDNGAGWHETPAGLWIYKGAFIP